MAGAMTLLQAAQFCLKMAAGVSYQQPLTECMIVMEGGVRQCFRDQSTPDGQPWPALKFGRRRGSKKAARLLQDTARLRDSLTSQGAGSVREISAAEAVLGSNLVYARIHNAGGKVRVTARMRRYLHRIGIHLRRGTQYIEIPARPYIGHRPENQEVYEEIFADFEERRARTTNG